MRARIAAAASLLGVADPVQELGAIFHETFARPAADPAYPANRLQPGALPLEWSFSELDPGALRLEIQPFDPQLAPGERLASLLRELLPLVARHFGEPAAARFRGAIQENSEQHPVNFGAFLGLVAWPKQPPRFKVYVELGPGGPAAAPPLALGIQGAVPHFRSVSIDEGGIAERVYFLCQGGLRLLDLESVCAALGIPHRFAALLVAMLELSGGEFYLPARSALLGIRRNGAESELKVELVCGPALPPRGISERIRRLLQPETTAAFQRWCNFVNPEAAMDAAVSVVSLKVSSSQPVYLSVYAVEPWSGS